MWIAWSPTVGISWPATIGCFRGIRRLIDGCLGGNDAVVLDKHAPQCESDHDADEQGEYQLQRPILH